MDETSERSWQPATIRDVAAHAGVSVATVSRVLSGSRPVGDNLADRVRSAAATLRYRPSAAARGLSLGTLRHVGVVMPQLSNPYFGEIIERLSRRARDAGFRLLIADAGDDPAGEPAAAQELLQHVDGLVLLSPRMPVDDLRLLVDQKVPLVLVNRLEPGLPVPTVLVDNAAAMTTLCGHLHRLGHRSIAYLGGPQLAWQDRERWRALRALEGMGIVANRIESDGGIEGARAAADAVLATGATAVVCFNDLSALGLIGALAERGIECPTDISISGFDDLEIARHITPALTTVAVDKVAIADRAWECLVSALEAAAPADHMTIPITVIPRSSTGSPAHVREARA